VSSADPIVEEEFPDEEETQKGNNDQMSVHSAGGGGAQQLEAVPAGSEVEGVGAAMPEKASDESGLSFDSYCNLQDKAIITIDDEVGKAACRTVMECWKSADEALSLSSRLQGGMGGSSSAGAVYGELVVNSLVEIFLRLSLNDQDVFIDIGSGCGIPTLLASELCSCKASIGLESHETRSYMAQVLATEMLKKCNEQQTINARVVLQTKDISDHDLLTLDPVTKLFCFSTGMPPDTLKSLLILMMATSTLRTFVLFHNMDKLLEILPAFANSSFEMEETVASVGSGSSHAYYVYKKVITEIVMDAQQDRHCSSCASDENLDQCVHCRAPYCPNHVASYTDHSVLCQLIQVACNREDSIQFHKSLVDAFSEKPRVGRREQLLSLHQVEPNKASGELVRVVSTLHRVNVLLLCSMTLTIFLPIPTITEAATAGHEREPFQNPGSHLARKFGQKDLVELTAAELEQKNTKGIYYYVKDSAQTAYQKSDGKALQAVAVGRSGKHGLKDIDAAYMFPAMTEDRGKRGGSSPACRQSGSPRSCSCKTKRRSFFGTETTMTPANTVSIGNAQLVMNMTGNFGQGLFAPGAFNFASQTATTTVTEAQGHKTTCRRK